MIIRTSDFYDLDFSDLRLHTLTPATAGRRGDMILGCGSAGNAGSVLSALFPDPPAKAENVVQMAQASA